MKFLTVLLLTTLVALGYSVTCWSGSDAYSNKPIPTSKLTPLSCPGNTKYCSKTLVINTVTYSCGIICDKNGKKDLPGAVMYCCDGDRCNSVGAKGISAILMVVSLATSLII